MGKLGRKNGKFSHPCAVAVKTYAIIRRIGQKSELYPIYRITPSLNAKVNHAFKRLIEAGEAAQEAGFWEVE